MNRNRLTLIAIAGLVSVAVGACAGQSPSTQATPTIATTPRPTQVSLLPDGSWQVDLTAEELVAAGAPSEGTRGGVFSWTFDAGRARINVRQDDGSSITCEADLEFSGDLMLLSYDPTGTCGDSMDKIRWTLEDDGLHLSLVGGDEFNRAYLEAKVWQPVQGAPLGTRVPVADQTFTIAGNELFARCIGAGAPAVILIHGMGGSHQVWGQVESSLAEHNLVCMFDRVNAGNSAQDPARHTITDSAAELDDFLRVVGIPTPVVLVGASFGGEIALMYAGLHPENVSGMVLVDAVLPLEDELTAIDPYVTSIAQITAELNNNTERVDFYEAYATTNAVLPHLPDVPITYMRALGDDWPNWAAGLARYDELLRAWIDGLPQGKLVDVDSGHDIQWEMPGSVITETELVLGAIR